MKLAETLNCSLVRLAPKSVAENATGQKLGNISPLFVGESSVGLVTIVDSHILDRNSSQTDIIYGGAGSSGYELRISVGDLLSSG